MSLARTSSFNPSPLAAPAVADTLARLVRINSVNTNHSGPAGGERAVMECAAAYLREHGIAVTLSEPSPGKPLLRARLAGSQPGPPLMLETHVDTVSTAGMVIDPFAGEVRAGRLWGRGATDAKGQCAAMLHALAAWAMADAPPPQGVELALVTDEEYGFGGAKNLLADGITARAIVIGEPTELRVVTAHKGTIRWWVRCHGKSAHGALPHLGVNAISVAARMIGALERELLPRFAARATGLLSAPTLNIGRIEGGIQVNLVPPECAFQLDRRIVPGETEAGARAELDALLQQVAADIPGARVTVEPATLLGLPLGTDPHHPLAVAAGLASAACGGATQPIGVDYATDACVLAATGLPMIVAGPGSIAQAHTEDEFIDLAQLEAGARFYALLIGSPIPA